MLFAGDAADKAKAVQLFIQAAEGGDAASMAFLGNIYLTGDGVATDRQTAVEWYRKAARAGHAGSAAKLAELALGEDASPTTKAHGDRPVPSAADKAKATQLVDRANALLATAMSDSDAREKAMVLFEQAAELGDPVAIAELAFGGLAGLGGPYDPETGHRILLDEIDRGSPRAMMLLAQAYSWGQGLAADPAEAMRLYQLAADAGNVEAIGVVGFNYLNGLGVKKDPERGFGMMLDASRQGDPGASHFVGRAYLDGTVVKPDGKVAAQYLFRSLRAHFFLSNLFLQTTDWSTLPPEFRKEMQRLLKADGFYKGAIDGQFGDGTWNAIVAASGDGPR